MDDAFVHFETHGAELQSDYPYTGRDGTCTEDKKAPQVKVLKFADVPAGDQNQLAAAIQKGPVSVAIEADKLVFQFYGGGVLDSTSCGQNLDHGVTAVGYGFDTKS